MITQTFKRLSITARSATSVVLLGTVVSNLARLFSTIILTRLLEPSAYGMVGILISIAFIVNMLTDVGIFGYIVRHSLARDPVFLDKIWTLRLIRCIGLMLIVIVLAPVISWILDKPVTLAIIIYSLIFAIEGLTSLTFATSVINRQLFRLTLLEIVPQFLTLPVTIFLAMAIRSFWALEIAMLFNAAATLALSYTLFPDSRRRIHYCPNEAHDLWVFGRAINRASVIQLVLMQADKILLARLLPLSTFGSYTIASTLVATIRTFNSNYVQRILYPAFAGVRNAPKSLQSMTFYSTGRQLRSLYAFAAGGFWSCAPLIIKSLYDTRFHGAASFLSLLAIANLVSMSTAAANQMLMALGKTRHFFNLNLVRILAFLAIAAIGFKFFGPLGLIAAVSGMELAAQVYCWAALHREGIFSLRQEIPYAVLTGAGVATGWIFNVIGLALLS